MRFKTGDILNAAATNSYGIVIEDAVPSYLAGGALLGDVEVTTNQILIDGVVSIHGDGGTNTYINATSSIVMEKMVEIQE